MTRLESGAIAPKREAVEVGELVGTRAAPRRAAPGRITRRASTCARTCRCCALDFVLIEQVLFNLLDNAAKYSPAGSRSRSRRGAAGRRVVISVRDEGPGIPPADARADLRQVLPRRRRRPPARRHRPGARHLPRLRRGHGRHDRRRATAATAARRGVHHPLSGVLTGRRPAMTGDAAMHPGRRRRAADPPAAAHDAGGARLPGRSRRRAAPRRCRRCATTGPTWCCSISACPTSTAWTVIGRMRDELAGADRRAVEPRRRGGQGRGARCRRRRLRHQAVRHRRADGPHPRRPAPPPAAAGRRAGLPQRRLSVDLVRRLVAARAPRTSSCRPRNTTSCGSS